MLAAVKSSSSSMVLLIYLVLFAAVYFLYLRPRSRRQKAQRAEARNVEIGERAQTVGGFVGTVVRREEGLVTLRSESGVELEFIPSAIARRFDPPPAAAPESQESGEEEPPSDGGRS